MYHPEAESVTAELTLHKCPNCGSDLHFSPGTTNQVCKSCNHESAIDTQKCAQEEIDFIAFLNSAQDAAKCSELNTATCPSCSAVSTIEQKTTSTSCPFCGTQVVVSGRKQIITPSSLLPFVVDERTARGRFAAWTKKLWFAPSDFKKAAYINERFQGIYLPYWTFDSFTETRYSGQRGDAYYETQSYTTTVNGKRVNQTRQVRKIRWRAASGTIHNHFNDILVPASQTLPTKHIENLEPWDLEQLVQHDARFISGFKSECYSINLAPGFDIAKMKMQPTIDRTIRDDIGGDEQRIIAKQSHYSQVTFKHILLPIWISACRYRGQVYRFLVNGRTGEVQGDRPWSRFKIAFAIIAVLTIIISGVFFANETGLFR